MDELEFLLIQQEQQLKKIYPKMSQPDSKTFVGSGKALEIKEYVKEMKEPLFLMMNFLLHSLKIWKRNGS
jgi:50S ribosomal subunit-associated GTPase HflX